MARKTKHKQKTIHPRFKFITNRTAINSQRKKSYPIPVEYTLSKKQEQANVLNLINQFYNPTTQDKRKLKKLEQDIKKLMPKRHRRKVILSGKKINKIKIRDIEITEYKKAKVTITKGKRKVKYKQIKITKAPIPDEDYYGTQKILTDKGDIFYLKYKNEGERTRILKKLIRRYEISSFRVVSMGVNIKRDLFFVDNTVPYKERKKIYDYYQRKIL